MTAALTTAEQMSEKLAQKPAKDLAHLISGFVDKIEDYGSVEWPIKQGQIIGYSLHGSFTAKADVADVRRQLKELGYQSVVITRWCFFHYLHAAL